eukprot:PhF_6_TR22369/c0_g1_i6/m.31718
MLVNNLVGFERSDGYFFSGYELHTVAGKMFPSDGGRPSMERFFATHQCTAICKGMKLENRRPKEEGDDKGDNDAISSAASPPRQVRALPPSTSTVSKWELMKEIINRAQAAGVEIALA